MDNLFNRKVCGKILQTSWNWSFGAQNLSINIEIYMLLPQKVLKHAEYVAVASANKKFSLLNEMLCIHRVKSK